MTVFRPADAAEVAGVVAWAAGEAQALAVRGGGSKHALGRPVAAEHTLDLHRLSGIVDYAPSELVLTARAATPLDAIADAIERAGQMLAFEPPDWSALLGTDARPTLGGVIAANQAGPRRVRAGAPRDHFLGFAAVNGWGDAWKAGGKVVKNVTGYDMCKLQAGAFGTLSVLTEVTVKALPRPETEATLLLRGLDEAAGLRAMADALNTPHEVSAAAHLPPAVTARAGLPLQVGEAATLLRIEGPRPSVAFRLHALAALFGPSEQLLADESAAAWRLVGAVRSLLRGPIVWRLAPTPSAAAALVNTLCAALPSAEAFYDWGGGQVWLALDDEFDDAGAATVRAAMRDAGGHATLFAAPEALRARVPVFEPQPAPVLALTRRVKDGFDPRRVLNPGRMVDGI